MELLEVLNMP